MDKQVESATDVAIIGGGPAGSALGCYLAQAGISNTIFDGAIHPRPHVGESLVTSTTRVFKDIDFLKVMEREGFVHKYGAAWHAPGRSAEFSIRFREFPQVGVDQQYTYHVDRSKFDLLLLKHAEQAGSKICQGVSVREVLFDGDRACGVSAEVAGQVINISSRVVVDASGRKTLLGRQLNIKKNDPLFNQFAVHAWYRDVNRGQGESADYIHIYFLPVERGWAWQIPISENVTSIGIVAEREVFRESRLDQKGWFASHLADTPDLARAMASAKRINAFKSEGDYSYCMDRFCGDGWLLIGDAARFVDPIFSSGVSVALTSAKFASEKIVEAFRTSDFSHAHFESYERKLRSGVEVWYEFIRLYYKLLPSFTYFIQSKAHRLQVLELLQGEVYERQEVPVLDAMRRFIKEIEEAPDTNLLKKSLRNIAID